MNTLTDSPEVPKAFEPIHLELELTDIQQIMSAYLTFLQLPEAERLRLSQHDETRPRTGFSGYVEKSHQDKKHVFHMSQSLEEEFLPKFYKYPAEARDFMFGAREVFYSIARSAKVKYQELEEEMPGILPIHFPRSGRLLHRMRFLAYSDHNDGTLAKAHYDKGTGTIAVAESHGGLRIGFGPDDLQPVDRSSYDPVFFAGFGWHQLAEILDAPPGSRRAGWHDVVDTGQRVDDETLRWALIY